MERWTGEVFEVWQRDGGDNSRPRWSYVCTTQSRVWADRYAGELCARGIPAEVRPFVSGEGATDA